MTSHDIEAVARAFCDVFGRDPDETVRATGYSGAALIPQWHLEREWAVRCLVAMEVMASRRGICVTITPRLNDDGTLTADVEVSK